MSIHSRRPTRGTLSWILSALLALAPLALAPAQTPTTWSPAVVVPTKVAAGELAYLNEVFKLMASSDFTFLYRQDSDHWSGLYRDHLMMTLHVHDGPGFDFRALVDPKTGGLTLTRGVVYSGKTRAESAVQTATQGLGYLNRIVSGQVVFGAMAMAPGSATGHDAHAPAAASTTGGTVMSPNNFDRLLEGNKRYVSGQMNHANQGPARRNEVATAQHPFAIIVSCSDSRVPPEVVFDQGLGDLFVIRTAGEVLTEVELGSIEYAVEHLGANLIVVMGHERCGAVDATIKGGEVPPNIGAIVKLVQPAVDQARLAKPTDLLTAAIKENAKNMQKRAQKSEVLANAMKNHGLSIVAAYYDLDTGAVEKL